MPPQTKRTTVRRLERLPRPSAGQLAALPLVALEGQVHAVDDHGGVRAVLADGVSIRARCPSHIDHKWLQAAARVAPVEAVFVPTQPSGRHVLWAIFPDRAHADVVVDVVIRGREVRIEGESLRLGAAKAQLRLERDGTVAVKGRDITSHARRVNRIKGGAIRLN
jgi:hypothetical protein